MNSIPHDKIVKLLFFLNNLNKITFTKQMIKYLNSGHLKHK